MGRVGAEVKIFRVLLLQLLEPTGKNRGGGKDGWHATPLFEQMRQMPRTPVGLGKLPRDLGHLFSSPPIPTKGLFTIELRGDHGGPKCQGHGF